jgi:hypothetical protein
MIEACEQKGDKQGLKFWRDILVALDILTIDGMSDEEDGIDMDEQVRYVKDLDFRHPDFRTLFKKVDKTRTTETTIFTKTGRKSLRRVYVPQTTSRSPPSELPSSFYRPKYLELMMKGKVPNVEMLKNPTLSIPRYAIDIPFSNDN